ncbi:endodeoxyribonuclease [Didymosphaeria variabile]|uniref:DNA topoisomerase (ATP-hydrolyzing) n=1 Tax=Didymosphaeria variabile TaxID=1932322 RepID=A0A9W9C6D1_9PLEO|nr:endodeoxyribonuclease [Didymosphaeria variabile]KAJ4346746.1 endodeoxyribonuclease [Didymosphaeria variabile]
MDAVIDSDADELLFESPLLSPPDSQSWDLREEYADDDILQDYFDDSRPLSTFELDDQCEGSQGPPTVVPTRDWVIGRIESMLERIVDGLLTESEQLTISLKTCSRLSRRELGPAQDTGTIPTPKDIQLSYPGNNAQDARRFTVVVRILELIHCCLIDGVVMTKRYNMYYRHPDLFGKQSVVDRYVDDIARTLGVSRSLLNVTAAAKGLIAGNFSILPQTPFRSNCFFKGLLVPTMQAGDTLEMSCVHWILVIEKEVRPFVASMIQLTHSQATFRSVLSSPLWNELGIQGLILTAKGYPDLVSRKFLRELADNSPHIPMYALVDLDPDGMHILSTYKYGSLRLAHEDVAHMDIPGVYLPNLQWLGVQSHHINRAPGNEGDTATAALADVQGVMKLTARDRKKAHHMLEWGVCGEHGSEPTWRAELQRLLMLNIKAEMQILDELRGGLVSWLSYQLEVMQGGSADDEILF